jgi:hypothetical protein
VKKWEGRTITSFLANNSCPWPTYINPKLLFSWEMEIFHIGRMYISTWRFSIYGSTLFVIGIKQVKIIDLISRIHHMKLVVLTKVVIPTNRNKRQKNVCDAICKCICSRKTTLNKFYFKLWLCNYLSSLSFCVIFLCMTNISCCWRFITKWTFFHFHEIMCFLKCWCIDLDIKIPLAMRDPNKGGMLMVILTNFLWLFSFCFIHWIMVN